MVAPKRFSCLHQIAKRIRAHDEYYDNLPGIRPHGYLECLSKQIIDAHRRVQYVSRLREVRIDACRADPQSGLFDPLRAAVFRQSTGDLEDAYWLTFLATHFGKHRVDGWQLTADIYGRLGEPTLWNWIEVKSNRGSFRQWLSENSRKLSGRRFSNHRKYESLSATSSNGTAAVVESYVQWAAQWDSHYEMIRDIHTKVGQNPIQVFDALYSSMDSVIRFGRLGKFDFLTMLGKLGISPIEPGSAYLRHGATGPLRGAKLLFHGSSETYESPKALDKKLEHLGAKLDIGMQVLEDALCNWAKDPVSYRLFRG